MKTLINTKGFFQKCFTFLIFLGAIHGYSQTQYTDITPDVRFSHLKDIEIDIDGDNLTDVTFTLETYVEFEYSHYKYKILPADLDVEFAYNNGAVSALNHNDIIDDNLNWGNADRLLFLLWTYGGEVEEGNWYGVNHGFVGIRISKGDQVNFAWLRINIDAVFSTTMWVSDFGYNPNAGEAIQAGDVIPKAATSTFGADMSDHLDGRDIQYSFTKALDETDITEYRICIAKAYDSAAYDLNHMNQLPNERYLSILVDTTLEKSIISGGLTEDAVDIDGDEIDLFTNYQVHILNISKSGNDLDNKLSSPSPEFFLQAYPEAVKNPVAHDNSNSNSASDIEVSFSKINNEYFINEYRVFILEMGDTANLSVEDLLALGEEYYTSSIPGDTNIILSLHPNQLVSNGNIITNNLAYTAVVASVADSNFSHASILSMPSRSFRLMEPADIQAGQKEGANVTYIEIEPAFQMDFYNLNTVYYDFDIDQDGTPDIEFSGFDFGSPMFHWTTLSLSPKENNKILLCEDEQHIDWTDLLKKNHQIGANYRWSNEKTMIYHSYYSLFSSEGEGVWGHLPDSPDEFYVGICIMKNENAVYAWVFVKEVAYSEYEIKEVAFLDISSSTNEVADQGSFSVYPNPASNYIIIENQGLKNAKVDIKVINSNGKLIDNCKYIGNIHRLEVGDYSTGIYYCKVSVEGNYKQTIKFIVY